MNGRLANVYSRKDTICALFNMLVKQNSFGRNPYYHMDPANVAAKDFPGEKVFNFENFDMSEHVGDHLSYRPTLDLVLEMTHFDS